MAFLMLVRGEESSCGLTELKWLEESLWDVTRKNIPAWVQWSICLCSRVQRERKGRALCTDLCALWNMLVNSSQSLEIGHCLQQMNWNLSSQNGFFFHSLSPFLGPRRECVCPKCSDEVGSLLRTHFNSTAGTIPGTANPGTAPPCLKSLPQNGQVSFWLIHGLYTSIDIRWRCFFPRLRMMTENNDRT